jgi:DNA-binding response OmpR family regulator
MSPQPCPRCAELAEDNRWLRRQLEAEGAADDVAKIREVFHVTPSEARMLELLHRRYPRVVSKGAIMDALYGDAEEEPKAKIIDVFLCKIKKRLGRDTIQTVWGQGLRLSEPFHLQMSETIAADHNADRRGTQRT